MTSRSDSNISIPDHTRNPEAQAQSHHHHADDDNDVDSDERLTKKKTRVIVLGAGVEGLTTALKIKERWGAGVEVEIVADVFPTDADPDSSTWNKGKEGLYTSWWAGGHYVSTAPVGTREAEIAHATFQEMWALSETGSESEKCFLRLEQTEFYSPPPPPPPSSPEDKKEGGGGKEANLSPHPFERMPEFRALGQAKTTSATLGSQSSNIDGIPPFLRALGATHGYSFQTVTIDVPVYLQYLTDQLRKYAEAENAATGMRFVRGHVLHLGQVLEGGSDIFWRDDDSDSPSIQGRNSTSPISLTPTPSARQPDAVIVCLGLGARFLGGVEDRDVYPSRGQTVILRAPWVRFGRSFEDEANGVWTYIIPRRSGDVVVGGIQGVGDWYTKPRPETTRDLLERGLKLCPELVPPEIRRAKRGSVGADGGTSVGGEPQTDDEIMVNDTAGLSIDDLIPLIVEEGCGLRPMRKGGARIELEWMDVPGPGSQVEGRASREGEAVAKKTAEKRKVGVIYNYGHGTQGYIQSIGSAKIVLGLLEEVFVNACA